jgi:membrane-associated protease RseP (regulator of RpoE activity)
MTLPDTDVLTTIVARIFRVDEVTLGDPKQGYFMRYRGELLLDSTQAYDQLAEALRPYDITPMFRVEEGRQTVLLIVGIPHPKLGPLWVNILLFVLTLLSVLDVGLMYSGYTGPTQTNLLASIWLTLLNLWRGWPFAVSLLGILVAHELGHYFVGRARGAAVTLPYFLPLPPPFSPIGTLGAFIQMKSIPKNKRSLFDLAVAGPLAGMVVAVPVLILGLILSPVEKTQAVTFTKTASIVDACPNTAKVGQTYICHGSLEGNSILYLGLKYLVKGELLPAPSQYTTSPVLYWIRYFFTSTPLPIGGRDVMLHPVAMAGWVGLLVTFLNLLPAGQLDGGHVIYAVFGKKSSRIVPFLMVILVLLGFLYTGWWLWAFLILLLGRSHAEPLDQITQLDPNRKALAVLMLVIFLLVLTPIPLTVF